MKTKLIILFLILTGGLFAQKIDTVINTGSYKSYFNKALREPVYVSYVLFHGGGECDRTKFHFHNDTKLPTATPKDYAGNGYDEGHLADAEDFAYDCKLDELTFRFYNCVPQTPNLNRGIWKHWETEIRKESQTDSLFIICGSVFGTKKMGEAAVPDFCWKVVIQLKTGKVLHALYFTNKMSDNTVQQLDLKDLEAILKYNLPTKP